MHRATLLIAVVFFVPVIMRGQDAGPGKVLIGLQTAATQLLLRASAQESQVIDEIAGHATFLVQQEELASDRPSDDFLRSVELTTSVLRDLPTEGSQRFVLLNEVRVDLQLKRTFVTTGAYTAVPRFSSVIDVSVETRRAGVPVSGLFVRSNPRRYGVTTSPMYIFSSASTPTRRDMPPGAFVMWVEDASGKVLSSQPVDLGASGSAESIVLAVP